MNYVTVRMSEEEIMIVDALTEKYKRLLGSAPKRHWILRHLIIKGFESVSDLGDDLF